MVNFYVYILKCSDQSYYVGHTDNIELRLSEHRMKKHSGYTATRLPVELVFLQLCASRDEALNAEQQIKGWSRKKKEALTNKNWQELIRLARNKQQPNSFL